MNTRTFWSCGSREGTAKHINPRRIVAPMDIISTTPWHKLFCKCGERLDSEGRCPRCDREEAK